MKKLYFEKSFTLVEVVVGTALLLIIFLGVFGAYQLGLTVLGQSERKIAAMAVANAQMETIRNLPYESIGLIAGTPAGDLPATTTITSNGINFLVETRIDYIDDPLDGSGPSDTTGINDYKKVEIIVSWSGNSEGKIVATSDFSPDDLTQESSEPTGLLSVLVADSHGTLLSYPEIYIKDPDNGQIIKTAIPESGKADFILAPGNYKIVVSKNGYNTEETYGTNEIANPTNPNPLVLLGQWTQISLFIDHLSSLAINTRTPWGSDYFFDSFMNESKISEKSDLTVSNEEVNLATDTSGYLSSGYLFSDEILPMTLISWNELSFSNNLPDGTDLNYQIYYASGTDWYLIPDSDLAGNSSGFDVSPLNLSSLSTYYDKLKLKANFSTNSSANSPTLYDWQISWTNTHSLPIPSVNFNIHGAKIKGKDGGGNPIYEYSQDFTSDGSGYFGINSLEWDNYTFTSKESNLDLAGTNPSPQPIGLPPGTATSVDLYLEAQNSLLITVEDDDTLEPMFLASVRLYNSGLGYDKTQVTDSNGQVQFIPLNGGTYNIDVTYSGYNSTSTSASVNGHNFKTIKLQGLE